MTALTWDPIGARLYETGVDKGVLYPVDGAGVYSTGFAWNGLTTITEKPSGADASPHYADNQIYLNLVSSELFGAALEAYTYPDEFAVCDGTIEVAQGVNVHQQARSHFGLSYRTKLGNDLLGTDYGYKLHLVYGALAAVSQKAYASINATPEAIAFAWEITTTPVNVTGMKPTSLIVIDSTQVGAIALAALELILYGATGVSPRLPLPDEVLSILGATGTPVRLTDANAPSYNAGTHVVMLPAVANIVWKINGVTAAAGAQPALTVGQTSIITAVANPGYNITGDNDWVFDY